MDADDLATSRRRPRRRQALLLIDAPPADTRVIAAKASGPLFRGMGEFDYSCARCGALLCAGLGAGALAGVVFRCWCGALNQVPSP